MLYNAVECSDVTGRTKKRITQSKRARAGSLATVDNLQVARVCILQAFGLQMSYRLSLVLRLFPFVSFSFLLSLKPRPFVELSVVPRYACVPTAARSYKQPIASFFVYVSYLVVFLWEIVVVVVVFTLKAVPVSTQYFLTSVLVQLTRTPSVVTG